MSLPIEEYALIGDCHTAALVGRNGSIDWLCFPRIDSPACFAALLGTPEHGRWRIAPLGEVLKVEREYRDGTLILETIFRTSEGVVRLIDCMPLSDERYDVQRIVEGVEGSVAMGMELIIRFDYGSIVPWVRTIHETLLAIGGPDSLELRTPVEVRGVGLTTVAEFRVKKGDRIPFALTYRPSHEPSLGANDPEAALTQTEKEWRSWSDRNTYQGPWAGPVLRSLLTLKALTYQPTGGVVAAPTTSLPERAGGVRNWDYRFCWVRDATFTLNALLLAGYQEEAVAWRQWLLRAIAGRPEDLQTLYSVTGERRLEEYILDWLPGHAGSAPVRIGNAAIHQFQLDVYGELMDMLHLARAAALDVDDTAWQIQLVLLNFLEQHWEQPDEGIWEVRGPRRQFTHSKVMCWVAFDRAVKDVEARGLEAPVQRWKTIRDAIHQQVCREGFDPARNTFVQSYGSPHLDASLLMIPQVGFLPAEDPRVRGTIEAIERELMTEGLVRRYSTGSGSDGLPPGEGTFLPCSFWLADALVLTGRRADGEALFKRLLSLTNDVGLLSEEYDPVERRMLGNFPQALTHLALINTARLLALPQDQAQRASAKGQRPAAAAQTS